MDFLFCLDNNGSHKQKAACCEGKRLEFQALGCLPGILHRFPAPVLSGSGSKGWDRFPLS